MENPAGDGEEGLVDVETDCHQTSPMNSSQVSTAEAETLVSGANWYHGFEIMPGLRTNGQCIVDAGAAFDVLGVPADLAGQRFLDIGAWDGPYSFELERRGAQVVALDIQDPDRTGFNTAKRILGSRVEYVRGSVYELTQKLSGKFDWVSYLGVFYHLKHPIAAFEEIAAVLKPGGRMLFEGEIFDDYAETLRNVPWGQRRLLRKLSGSEVPVTLCYPGKYKNCSNWFIPNVACLRGWMEATGFEVTVLNLAGVHKGAEHSRSFWQRFRRPSHTRANGTAVKKSGRSVEECPLV